MNLSDFNLAGPWKEEVRALALGPENPPLDEGASGDGGRAFGILQQHPAFFSEYYGTNGFPASVKDTWTQAQIKAAASFFQAHKDQPLDLVVQAFNQGVSAVFDKGVRAPEYLAKFKKVYK